MKINVKLFICYWLAFVTYIVHARPPAAQLNLEIQGRIISGIQAAPGQFPWQVILKRDEYDDLLCGGSIIAPTWVLTAAHCAYGFQSLFLIFGTIDLNDVTALNITATQLYVHPEYNSQYLNNDVALIQLPAPLTFSNTIQPIALVSSSDTTDTFVGTVATIAGFGLIDDEYLDYSQILLYARVKIINNSVCLPIFGAKVVLPTTMCATGYNGSNMSTCSGDSGGPLISMDSSTGAAIQIGINSFVAEDRCTEGFPSGYVRLTSYLQYIQSITSLPLS